METLRQEDLIDAHTSALPAALGLGVVVGVFALAGAPAAQTPRRGGTLNAMFGEDPPGLSIHELATISGLWPAMSCYSNRSSSIR